MSKGTLSKLGRLLGSVVLFTVLAWRMDWDRVAKAFQGLDGRWWLAALGLYLLTQLVSSWRWQLFARTLGVGGSFRQYVSYYFVGMFFGLVLPTSVGGDVVRAWYLSHQPGPTSGKRMAALVSVLADRVSGVIMLAMVACVAALCCPVALPAWISGAVLAVGAGAIAGVFAIPILNPILQSPRFNSPRFDRLRRLVAGGAICLRDVPLMISTTLLSVVVQVNSVVMMGLIGIGLGLQVPPLYYGVLVPLMTLMTLLPISVNGMGLREASTVLLLAPLGIGTAEAVTLAFLAFAVQLVSGLFGVLPYLAGGLQHFDAKEAQAEADSALQDKESDSTIVREKLSIKVVA